VSSTRWCYAVGAAAVAGAIGASRRSRRTTCARGRQLALLAAEESQATREGGSSRAELFRGLAGSGLAGLSGLAAPAPVLAKGKAEAGQELSSYGLAELSPTEEPPFGWNWNIEPIGLTTQAYYGKFRLGSEPRILRFLCPASWVVSRPNIDFNGAAGTVQVNDYARGDSATLFVDGANTGKIQDFKKEDFNREIYKALTQKGTNFIQDINIDKVMDGDVPGYKIVEYSYEIYSGAGFTINRSGIASLSQAADTEALEIFWAGVVSGRWQDMGKDLTKIVRSFRCGKVPQGVKIDTLKEFKPLGENFKLDK